MLASPILPYGSDRQEVITNQRCLLVSIQHAPSSSKLLAVYCMWVTLQEEQVIGQKSVSANLKGLKWHNIVTLEWRESGWLRNMNMYHPPKQPSSLARKSQGNSLRENGPIKSSRPGQLHHAFCYGAHRTGTNSIYSRSRSVSHQEGKKGVPEELWAKGHSSLVL